MDPTKLLQTLRIKYPSIRFTEGASHHWSPIDQTVYYATSREDISDSWGLLHETSHAVLGHTKYKSDFELLLLEVDAWTHAKILAGELDIPTGSEYDEHREDCLDSYRDWQHKRSLCPQCNLGGLQINDKHYQCLFCNKTWSVSAARFCRPYRRTAI